MDDMEKINREVRTAEIKVERLERELWLALPAFERLQRLVGNPDRGGDTKNRAKEGIARACDELRLMLNDIYWHDKLIPF
jgi:hypothetical protein